MPLTEQFMERYGHHTLHAISINTYYWVYNFDKSISSIILSYKTPNLIYYIEHLYPFFYDSRVTFCLTGASDSLQDKLETIILCYLSGSFILVLKIHLTEWLLWQHTIISPPRLLFVLPYLLSISICWYLTYLVKKKKIKKMNRWWKSKHFKN